MATVKKSGGKAPARAARKTTAKKTDLSKIEVTGADMGRLLGMTSANVVALTQTGTLAKNENGMYPLQPTIAAYCRSLRERKSGDGKSELELEHIALKNEKLRQQLATWRTQRDREVALAILSALRNAMGRLRDECRLVPALTETIDAMLAEIDRVDVDGISYIVEGGDDDDEE